MNTGLFMIMLVIGSAVAAPVQQQEDKQVIDFLLNTFNLGGIWETIQTAGSGAIAQFQSLLSQLLFAGQQVIANARPIFAQLVADLQEHAGNAAPYVQNAIAQLQELIAAQAGKRSQKQIIDFLLNTFNLSGIWSTIQTAGSSAIAQFQSVLSSLLFAGQQVIANARPIFAQLVADLQEHAGNAAPYVEAAIAQLQELIAGQVGKRMAERQALDFILNTFGLSGIWSTVQTAGAAAVAQFQSVLSSLLFAGQQVWSQAGGIFSTLVADLQEHAGNASPYVEAAIAQLQELIAAQAGKRSEKQLIDFLLNTFNLGGIWETIQTAGSGAIAQFQSVLSNLLFAGQQVIANARPIFAQLVADLQEHAGNAAPYVQNAIAQLQELIAGQAGKRSEEKQVIDFLLNTFNLGGIWETIQTAGSGAIAQFQSLLSQLLFAGQQVIANARPIFAQLVADLQEHAGNAAPYVQNAIAQIQELIAAQAGRF